ncbi:MAG: hypothetical protein GY869_24170 [Planctomycetes bacterium]|nr:hypothetical protein [Planctomycetota bacterium]
MQNIGNIHLFKDEPETALDYYDRAITIGEEIGNKYGLCEIFRFKAEALFKLHRTMDARTINEKGLQIATELEREDIKFDCNILAAKIEFALNPSEKPITKLCHMIAQSNLQEDTAELNYELWKMHIQSKDKSFKAMGGKYQKEALRLYRKLFIKTPSFSNKKRIEELTAKRETLRV